MYNGYFYMENGYLYHKRQPSADINYVAEMNNIPASTMLAAVAAGMLDYSLYANTIYIEYDDAFYRFLRTGRGLKFPKAPLSYGHKAYYRLKSFFATCIGNTVTAFHDQKGTQRFIDKQLKQTNG